MTTTSPARSQLAVLPDGLVARARPAANKVGHLGRRLLRAHAPAERINKLAIGIHQVEEDGVVDQVVVRGGGVGRGREVDTAARAQGRRLAVSLGRMRTGEA